jgi:single-stranded DNA-binding protein
MDVGFSQKLKFLTSIGANTMFNFAFLSGNVLDEPELSFTEEEGPTTTFNLAIWVLQHPAGTIRVTCYSREAVIAAKYLHKGDRVVVVGFLCLDGYQAGEGECRNNARLIAIDLRLIKHDDRGLK